MNISTIEIKEYLYRYNETTYSITAGATINKSYIVYVKKSATLTSPYEEEINLEKLIIENPEFEQFQSLENLFKIIRTKLETNDIEIVEEDNQCEIFFTHPFNEKLHDFKINIAKKVYNWYSGTKIPDYSVSTHTRCAKHSNLEYEIKNIMYDMTYLYF